VSLQRDGWDGKDGWVGVIADNLIHMGKLLPRRARGDTIEGHGA